jgi:hypothetical protein
MAAGCAPAGQAAVQGLYNPDRLSRAAYARSKGRCSRRVGRRAGARSTRECQAYAKEDAVAILARDRGRWTKLSHSSLRA